AAPRRDVGAGGSEPGDRGAADAQRSDVAGGDGSADADRRRQRRETRHGGVVNSTPAGPNTDSGGRFPFGGHLTDLGYAAGWRLVRAMPEFLARNAFDAGAHYAARGGRPKQLRKNLARIIGVTPDKVPDGLIRASLASYARYWREAFRLPSMDLTSLGEQLDAVFAGTEHIAAALDTGRGAVMALPHSGNWDM